MARDADVLIVGAGPAGATAARTLAQAGAKVVLLDRARFPRQKPCGGGVTMRALDRFPGLGAALARITTHTVSRLRLEGPRGHGVTIESSRPAVLLVRRLEFDQLLVRLATEAGAELVEGATVSSVECAEGGVRVRTRDGRTFRAPMLVGADGVNGIVARRLGMRGNWPESSLALDIMEETPNEALSARDPATLWVSYGHDGSDGYAYIFPKRDHINVGVGWLLSFYRRSGAAPPWELQQRLIASLRERGLVSGQSSRAHFTPYLIPVGGPCRETARDRVLLAGDAGGFVNGYTAEGIYYAMVSGDLAARAIAGPTSRRSAARRYVRAWRAEIGAELADSVLIRRYLFSHAARVEGLVRGAVAHSRVAAMIGDYATGDLPYRTGRRRLFARFPKVAFRLALIAIKGR